jgi:CRP/FNR family transcriptional regulator, nitrogen oxide reductase regulator
LFAGIAAADVRAIVAEAVPRRFRAGATVTQQGTPADHLYLLTEGRARYFSSTPRGEKMLLFWLSPGDIIGGAALVSAPSAYRLSSETVKPTRMLAWSRPAIRALAARHPRITENALSFASDYLDWYIASHTALSCHTAGQRLAAVLSSLAPLLGRDVPGGIELDVTNEELASAAHVTSFTASRLLNQWQRRRRVIKRRGKLVLLAPNTPATPTS